MTREPILMSGAGLVVLDGQLAVKAAVKATVSALDAAAPGELTQFDRDRLAIPGVVEPIAHTWWNDERATFDDHPVERPHAAHAENLPGARPTAAQRRWDAQRQVTVVQVPVDILDRVYAVSTGAQRVPVDVVEPAFKMPTLR